MVAAIEQAIPVSQAATKLQIGRERLIRRIQAGLVKGEQRAGKWFVLEPAPEEPPPEAA